MAAALTLAGALAGRLAAPLAAFGQHPIRRPFRIGMMERTSPASNADNVDAFRRGMQELGYAEGEEESRLRQVVAIGMALLQQAEDMPDGVLIDPQLWQQFTQALALAGEYVE